MANAADHAAFYLCLARAFLPPQEPAAYDAIKLHLADDLDELAGSLGVRAGDALRELRRAVEAVPGQPALLQLYSRLFLAPPAPVRVNTGAYLDGAVAGASVTALEACYRGCGVERAERFHDLADHVAVQLEFVSLLFARAAERDSAAGSSEPAMAAGDFLASFVRQWLPAFCADLEEATRTEQIPANPYLHLARILRAAVAQHAPPAAASAPASAHPARG